MPDEVNEELQEAEEDKDELAAVLEDSQDKEGGDNKEEDKEDKEDKKAEGETDDKKGEGEKAEEEEPDLVKVLQGEVKDLRQMVRTSKRELTITQAKLERLGSKKVEAKDEDEDEDEDKEKKGKEESLSTVEELQQSISHVGATRGATLDILLETMEQSSKYEDIREICSRENFDDIFEAIATEATKDGAGNFDEALLEVELSVWNKTNPYKYMYNLIKKYHPSYTKKEALASPGDKKEDKSPVKTKAPGTIADKGGDSNVKSGWTAKRIDNLPEDELHTVPKEIYDRYMKDELD